ncbi:MarR family winged helix-turn-helix transcriptional regulator [Streptomyces diacarni]|uniref:MarR family winged helix-turn-helix transcriptional regulator n=1 Tax=Streptomyces diacarni TaxID=2800381 RepID=UPI003F4D5D6A
MPTHPDMTTDTSDTPGPLQDEPAVPADSGARSSTAVLDAMQHQLAVYARRAEQTRLGGLGQARNSMDRAAYLLLNRLDQEGPMGVKALAAGMGIDSSTVTRQVAPLVESGLVKRTSHPEDGRAVVLQLSPRGEARLEEVRSSRRNLMQLITQEWTEEERGTFCELLTRFNGAMLDLHPGGLGQPPRSGS